MQQSKKLALIMLGVLMSTAAKADNSTISYSYLSGGVAYDQNGWNKPLADFFKDGIGPIGHRITPQNLTPKRSSLGGYLHGSYALDDNIFLDAKLRYLGGRKNGYFVGVGYHRAVTDNSDFYVLGGISQPDLPARVRWTQKNEAETLVQGCSKDVISELMTFNGSQFADIDDMFVRVFGQQNGADLLNDVASLFPRQGIDPDETLAEHMARYNIDQNDLVNRLVDGINTLDLPIQKAISDSEISLKSKIAPTLEVGYRINFTDQLGARLAYRGSYDAVRMQGKFVNPLTQETIPINRKKSGLSHEGTLEVTYAFTSNLMAEAGYTMSKMFKIETIKPKCSHRYTVGLRYAF